MVDLLPLGRGAQLVAIAPAVDCIINAVRIGVGGAGRGGDVDDYVGDLEFVVVVIVDGRDVADAVGLGEALEDAREAGDGVVVDVWRDGDIEIDGMGGASGPGALGGRGRGR